MNVALIPALLLTIEGLWQVYTRRQKSVYIRVKPEKQRFLVLIPTYKDRVNVQSWKDALEPFDATLAIVEDGEKTHAKEDVMYFHRRSRDGFKGGAINYVLETLRQLDMKFDWVLIFDADHEPKKPELQVYLYYLSTTNSKVVQAFWEDGLPLKKWFHWLLWSGRQNSNWNLYNRSFRNLTGNGVAIHWELIEEGWYFPESITEDYALSLQLVASGYKIDVFPLSVSIGKAPESFKSFLRQQLRWAEGTLRDSLRNFNSVWQGLRWKERVEFLLHINLYFQGLWLFVVLTTTLISGSFAVLGVLGIIQALCYFNLIASGKLRYLPLYFASIYILMFVQIYAFLRAVTTDGHFIVTEKVGELSVR